jgi:hypothetical protein
MVVELNDDESVIVNNSVTVENSVTIDDSVPVDDSWDIELYKVVVDGNGASVVEAVSFLLKSNAAVLYRSRISALKFLVSGLLHKSTLHSKVILLSFMCSVSWFSGSNSMKNAVKLVNSVVDKTLDSDGYLQSW